MKASNPQPDTAFLSQEPATSYEFGEYTLVPSRQILLKGNQPIRIGSRAFDLLTALVERAGETVSKSELIACVWPSSIVEEGNLKVNIVGLRRTLGAASGVEKYIATVAGRGYRFVSPVKRTNDALPPVAIDTTFYTPPLRPMRVFGRSNEIQEILRVLRLSRLVSIVGPGGVGKTTVATEVARVASAERPDGIAFIDLSSIGSPQFISVAIASAFGIAVTGIDPLASVIPALRGKKIVIVVDNCEHLLAALTPTVERLASSLSNAWIIATSREPLSVSSEHVLRLGGLACDPRETPSANEAKNFAAIELFLERSQERNGFILTDDNAGSVAAICRRLDGNALAIELAATQTAQFDPHQILKLLDDGARALNLGPSDAPLRQQSLLATLDWSYRLLVSHEAAMLRAVSVFSSKFGVAEAADITGLHPDETYLALEQLAGKSLIISEKTGEATSYRILETTRSYCLERLLLSSEYNDVRRRHAKHLCSVLDQAADEWARLPAGEWGIAYASLLDDLRSALEWAGKRSNEQSLLIRLTAAGTILWNHFSLHQECRVRTSRALAELEGTEFSGTRLEMKLQASFVGSLIVTRGISEASLRSAKRALDLAEQIGDPSDRLLCLRNMYLHNFTAGELAIALKQVEIFISSCPASDPSADMGQISLALLEFWMGHFRSAEERLLTVVRSGLQAEVDTRLGQFLYEVNTSGRNVLANVQWVKGYPETAATTALIAVEGGLKLKHDLSLTGVLAVAACKVAFLSNRSEDLDTYLMLFEQTLSRSGLDSWRPWAQFYRGTQACAVDSTSAEGLDMIGESIAALKEMNHRQRLPFLLGVYAEKLCKFDRVDDARRIADEAMELARRHPERWCVPEILRVRAGILSALGRRDEAEAHLLESIVRSDEMGALSWRLRSATDLAALWQSFSHRDDAIAILRSTFGAFTEGFDTTDLVRASNLLAVLEPEQDGNSLKKLAAKRSRSR